MVGPAVKPRITEDLHNRPCGPINWNKVPELIAAQRQPQRQKTGPARGVERRQPLSELEKTVQAVVRARVPSSAVADDDGGTIDGRLETRRPLHQQFRLILAFFVRIVKCS